jgi:hypothetical protein
MLNKLVNSTDSPASRQQPTGQAPSTRRFGKKLYVTVAVIILITVVIATIFLVPSTDAEIISLGVHYFPGEKLTYDLTISSFSQTGNSSTNFTTQRTLTVDVVSINEDIYTLKYTTTSSTADNSTTTSYVMDVKEADMVNLFTLLPVAFQQYGEYAEYTEKTNSSSPLEKAFFNQSEAKVGDTWRIPVLFAVSGTPDAEITVNFVAIQNLSVEAENFKVFKIEFTQTSAQQNQIQFDNLHIDVSGESHLEFGSCKQIQSTVQFNMTTSLGANSDYSSAVTTFSSTLTKDEKP